VCVYLRCGHSFGRIYGKVCPYKSDARTSQVSGESNREGVLMGDNESINMR